MTRNNPNPKLAQLIRDSMEIREFEFEINDVVLSEDEQTAYIASNGSKLIFYSFETHEIKTYDIFQGAEDQKQIQRENVNIERILPFFFLEILVLVDSIGNLHYFFYKSLEIHSIWRAKKLTHVIKIEPSALMLVDSKTVAIFSVKDEQITDKKEQKELGFSGDIDEVVFDGEAFYFSVNHRLYCVAADLSKVLARIRLEEGHRFLPCIFPVNNDIGFIYFAVSEILPKTVVNSYTKNHKSDMMEDWITPPTLMTWLFPITHAFSSPSENYFLVFSKGTVDFKIYERKNLVEVLTVENMLSSLPVAWGFLKKSSEVWVATKDKKLVRFWFPLT